MREAELFRIIMGVMDNPEYAGECAVADYIFEFMPKPDHIWAKAIRDENNLIKKKMLMISLCQVLIDKLRGRMVRETGEAERKIRSECTHQSYTYEPDPSGNNDSSNCCDFCGKKLTRKERAASNES